jgi:hypothetical protein
MANSERPATERARLKDEGAEDRGILCVLLGGKANPGKCPKFSLSCENKIRVFCLQCMQLGERPHCAVLCGCFSR